MRIALVGNQNSGKTTLFNLLTGLNQKVGNWPGVTIERKSGIIKGTDFELVDLPGIYSLSPYSSEEDISRKFLLNENIDLIINIIDATSLERSLYLTTQLLELDINVVVALNMSDVMLKKGIEINTKALEEELKVRVVKISALKRLGINELIDLIRLNQSSKRSNQNIFHQTIENEIRKIEEEISSSHKRFIAIKLLEKDKIFNNLNVDTIESINKLEKSYQMDIEEIIASGRYEYINSLKNKVAKIIKPKESLTDKLDKVFLNKYLSIPIFILIMFFIYFLSVGVIGSWTVDFVDRTIITINEFFKVKLMELGASNWSVSLVTEGMIPGVGAVLNFVPQLIILFICISALENTGYMSRISFMLDKLFKKFGLSGKSLIPFIVGTGCSVPGIMTTRTIEDENERKMSIILTPFIPCSAKLPIIALFAGFFFDKHSGIVSFSLYAFAIFIILLMALLMKKYVYKSQSKTYISELPEYKFPNIRYVSRDVWERTTSFVKRAGSIILLAAVVLWVLLSFSWRFEYGVDINNSILASIGKLFSFLFYPMLGVNSWEAAVSSIQGLIAKEQVVSSMAIISGLAEDIDSGSLIFTATGPFGFFNSASAYSFMVFNLFTAPCVSSIGAMRRELGSTKQMLKAISFQTVLAWVIASIVYWTITLMGVIF